MCGCSALEKPYIASMGIYVMTATALKDMLETHMPEANDFGNEVRTHTTEMSGLLPGRHNSSSEAHPHVHVSLVFATQWASPWGGTRGSLLGQSRPPWCLHKDTLF